MSNNNEWSKEFNNVIKDTDKNIASIKKQLQVEKVKETNFSNENKGSKIFSPSLLSDEQFQDTSEFTSLPLLNKNLENIIPNLKSNNPTLKDKLLIESSSSLVKTLFSKVELLSQAVVNLKNIIESQDKEIKDLKENQRLIKKKMNIENIADAIRKDLQSQIDSICSIISKQKHKQMSSEKENGRADKLLITSLEEDINTMKREAFEMKQKIKTLERDIQTNSRNITGEISCIEKDVKHISQNQNILQRSAIKKEQFLENLRHELIKVSEDLNDLKEECSRSKIHSSNVFPRFSSTVKSHHKSYPQNSLVSSQMHGVKKHNQGKKKLNVSSPVTTVLSLNDLDQSLEELSFDLSNSVKHNKSTKSDFWESLDQSERAQKNDLKSTIKNSFDSDIDYSLGDFDEINDDLLEDELLTYDI